LPDGNIEYIGRIDHQVKIRGYRVELGEIENTILEVPGVKQVIVIIQENASNQKKLVAYIVLEDGNRKSDEYEIIQLVRRNCEEKLPDYMQPNQVMFIDSVPLTVNGKLDKKKLPEPEGREGMEIYQVPASVYEEKLAKIWSELLGIEKISRNDNFFNLGGDSLLAIRVVSLIRKNLKIEVPLKSIFKYLVLKDLAEFIDRENDSNLGLPAINKVERSQRIPLSYAQQRLWFLEELIGSSSLYHIPICVRLLGMINNEVLQKSLDYLVKRHESLRTRIVSKDGIAYQEIMSEDTGFNLRYIDEVKNEVVLNEKISDEIKRTFKFSDESLCRALLIKLEVQGQYILVFIFHHIIADGWSVDIFRKELAICYEAFSNQEIPRLSDLTVQYADYSIWQRNWLSGEILDKQLSYWKEKLEEVSSLNLPMDGVRPKFQTYDGGVYRCKIEKVVFDKIKEVIKEDNVTLFIFLFAVFSGLLSKLSNQDDIVVGTPIANRRVTEVENLIGFFVNTIAIRINLTGDLRFRELLSKVSEIMLEAHEHQDIPFEQLVDKLNINRDLSRHPIFQVMFLLDEDKRGWDDLGEVKITPINREHDVHSKFDITFAIKRTEDDLEIEIDYAKSLFEKNSIEKLAKRYQIFLEEVVFNRDKRLSEIGILLEEEIESFESWNDTKEEYEDCKSVVELFENEVIKSFDRIALVYEDSQLTYDELNKKSNQLAHYLIGRGIGLESLIGISMPRCIEAIICMIGILKSGGAYVPIDPDYPKERIDYVLEDSRVSILITKRDLADRYRDFKGEIIYIEEEKYKEYPISNLEIKFSSYSLAYVIYTSGSTGRPKGVAINHQGVANYLVWAQMYYKTLNSNFILHSSIAFDMAITSIYLPLISGKSQIILKEDFVEEKLDALILKTKEKFNIIKLTPSHLSLLKQNLYSKDHCSLIIGGEQLLQNDINDLLYKNLYNEYGPTEITVACTAYKITENYKNNIIPIGKPITNTQIYILDRFGEYCVVGSIGEIYIGGIGLARGYLNKPSMTADKFIPNPFAGRGIEGYIGDGEGSRLYRSGDLGRYLPDGNIEYVGRIDHQVKIRGYRVELGEIENAILEAPGVKQALVIVRGNESNQNRLLAYIVLEDESSQDDRHKLIKLIRNCCEEKLPDYMQPNQVMFIDAIPLTVNGKLDRDSLPKLDGREGMEVYQEPTGIYEEKLAKIWSELLGIEKISRNDNFFNLGGDSIISIQLVSRAKKEGIFLEVRQIFVTPTVKGLVENCIIKDIDKKKIHEKVIGEVELLSIQRWFFCNRKNINHYNQAFWIVRKGEVELERLKESIREIRKHHDSFRLRYRQESNEWLQYYQDKAEECLFDIIDQELTEEELNSRITELHKSLDIKNGPIDRLLWVKGRGLLWIIHHLIVDGVSWRILLEDINNLYNDYNLGEKSNSYKDWSNYLNKHTDLEESSKYYNNINYYGVNHDYKELTTVEIYHKSISFTEDLTSRFIKKSHSSYNTSADDLLLLALLLSIGDVFGRYELTINLEGHGRESLNSEVDITRTIGWFTTLYPVELTIKNAEDIDKSIKEVKEHLRNIPDKGINYGIGKYLGKIKSHNVDVLFNYLGQLDSGMREDNKFGFGNYPIGEAIGDKTQDHLIEINGQVQRGVLELRWSYRNELREDTANKIMDRFKQRFIQIVDHCVNQNTIHFTPSDFDAENINQLEIDEIIMNMNN